MIFNVLPIVLVGFAMILIFQLGISLKNNEIPNVFNRAILYVKTGSMEPTIMTGDLIIVNVNPRSIEQGDIITFRKPDQPEVLITHRITAVNGNLITTKGDNNLISDGWEINFSKDYVVGKYLFRSAFLGSVYELLFLNSINLLFVFVISVFLIIALIEIKNIIIYLSKQKQIEIEKEKQEMIEKAKKMLQEEKDL
jgi:signal peptidase I